MESVSQERKQEVRLNRYFFFYVFLYLPRQVSYEQILIYNDSLGTVGERQIFTLSARGFDLATFRLLAQH